MPPKPPFQAVPLAAGLCWRGGGGWVYQEKMDGRWAQLEHAGALLVGEQCGPQFWAFDLLRSPAGADLSPAPLRERLQELHSLWRPDAPWRIVAAGNGGEFLEAVLARGGEGVVAKPLDAPFGSPWFKCKRLHVFYAIIRELDNARGAARLELLHSSWQDVAPSPFETSKNGPAVPFEDFATGDDGGWLALRSRFDQVRLGSVLKLEAFGQHPTGRLREARLDQDAPGSWLVKL